MAGEPSESECDGNATRPVVCDVTGIAGDPGPAPSLDAGLTLRLNLPDHTVAMAAPVNGGAVQIAARV
jgi:hypothetical protein